MSISINDLHKEFENAFTTKSDNAKLFFAPGRINLIGEHTDYNGGHVFPASISFGTYCVATKRNDSKLRFYSMNFEDSGIIEVDLNDLDHKKEDDWANFPKGMMKLMSEHGCQITSGLDVLYYGNIPNGAGLSSSASIEMVTGVMLEGLFNFELDRIEMIKLGQKVENDYIGVNSGIMDQFAIGMGKKDHAIHLDTATLEYTYAPIELPNHSIVIINTNKKRTLAGSEYNNRRTQCEQALADLQAELKIESLGELTPEEFEANKQLIKDEVNQKRAKHAVYENARTLDALEKLKTNDLVGFGKLMNESHLSLQHDYEVTGIELDTIAETAWEQEGVLGARMTGAGFGGCAIAIVEDKKVNQFKDTINNVYLDKIGHEPIFYTAYIGDGAKEITREVK